MKQATRAIFLAKYVLKTYAEPVATESATQQSVNQTTDSPQ